MWSKKSDDEYREGKIILQGWFSAKKTGKPICIKKNMNGACILGRNLYLSFTVYCNHGMWLDLQEKSEILSQNPATVLVTLVKPWSDLQAVFDLYSGTKRYIYIDWLNWLFTQ